MPSKFDNLSLGKEHDRRRSKLTDEDRLEIKRLFHQEKMPKRAIARLYADKCSRSLICIMLDDHRASTIKNRVKNNWKTYYDKEKHTIAIRNIRKYKKELVASGALKIG